MDHAVVYFFHFTENCVGQLFALSEQAEIYCYLFQLGVAVLIVSIWRPGTLTRRRESGVIENRAE